MSKHKIKIDSKSLKENRWTLVQLRCDSCKQEYIIGMKDYFYGEGDAIIPECLYCGNDWKQDEYKGTWEGFSILGTITLSSFPGQGIRI